MSTRLFGVLFVMSSLICLQVGGYWSWSLVLVSGLAFASCLIVADVRDYRQEARTKEQQHP